MGVNNEKFMLMIFCHINKKRISRAATLHLFRTVKEAAFCSSVFVSINFCKLRISIEVPENFSILPLNVNLRYCSLTKMNVFIVLKLEYLAQRLNGHKVKLNSEFDGCYVLLS
jgi:hypothetical protein